MSNKFYVLLAMMLCTCGVAIGSSTYIDQCANFNVTTQQCTQTILDVAWEDAGGEYSVVRTTIPVYKQVDTAYNDVGTDIFLYNIPNGTISFDSLNPEHRVKITQLVGTGSYAYEVEVPFSVDTQYSYCYSDEEGWSDTLCSSSYSNGWLKSTTFYVMSDYPSSPTNFYLYTTSIPQGSVIPFTRLYYSNQTICNGCVSEYSNNKYPALVQWNLGTMTYKGGDYINYEWLLDFDTDFDLTYGQSGYYTLSYCSSYGVGDAGLKASQLFGVTGCNPPSFSNFDTDPGTYINSTTHMNVVLTGCNAFGLGAGTGSLFLDVYPNAIYGELYISSSGTPTSYFDVYAYSAKQFGDCQTTSTTLYTWYTPSNSFNGTGQYKDYTQIGFGNNNTLYMDGATTYYDCDYWNRRQCSGASIIGGIVGSSPYAGWKDTNSVYGQSGVTSRIRFYPDSPFVGGQTIQFYYANAKEYQFGAWASLKDKAHAYGKEGGKLRVMVPGESIGYEACGTDDTPDYCSSVIYDPVTSKYILSNNYNIKCENGYLGYDNYCGSFVSCQTCGSCVETRDAQDMLTKVMCGTTCMGIPTGFYCGDNNNKYLNTTCGSSLVATCNSGKCENGECVGGVSGAITVVDTVGNWLGGSNIHLQSETDYYNVTGTTDGNGMLQFNLPADTYDITITKDGFTTVNSVVVVDSTYYSGCSPVSNGRVTGISCRFTLKSGIEANDTSLRVIVMDETYTPMYGVTVNFTSPTQSFEWATDPYGKYGVVFNPANETVNITLNKPGFVPESDSVYLTTGQDLLLTYIMIQVSNITVTGNAGTGSRFMNGKAILSVTPPITGTMTVLRQDVIAYRCSDSTCTTYKPMTFFQPIWEPGSSPDDKGISSKKRFGSKTLYDLFEESGAKYGALGNVPIYLAVSIASDLVGSSSITSTTSPTFTDTNFMGRQTETIDITINGVVKQVRVIKNFRSNSTHICSMFGDSVNLMYYGGYNSFLTDYVIFDVHYDAYFADILDSNTYSLNVDGAKLDGTRTEIKTNPIFKPYLRRGYPSHSWMRGYELNKFVRTLKAQRVTAGTTMKLTLMESDVVGDIFSRLQKGDHSSVEPTTNDKACASLTLDDSNFKVITYVTMMIDGDDGSKSIVTVPLESRTSNVNWFAPEKIMILGAIAGLVIPFVLAILLFILFLILG